MKYYKEMDKSTSYTSSALLLEQLGIWWYHITQYCSYINDNIKLQQYVKEIKDA